MTAFREAMVSPAAGRCSATRLTEEADAASVQRAGEHKGDAEAFITNAHLKSELLCTTGPGAIYDIHGSIGQQPSSRNRSYPAYSVGKDAKMQMKPHFSPGPGNYNAQSSSLGKQTLHTKRTFPTAAIGKLTRQAKVFLGPGHMSTELLQHSAPVGSYSMPSMIGKQSSSRNETLPSYSFAASRTTRFKNKQEEFAASTPGPQAYGTQYSIGRQTKSQNRTAPVSSFGSSTREVENKRFLTAGHTKVAIGRAGEPAASYSGRNTASFGNQVNSTRRNGPSYGFGSGKKMHFRAEYTPGPGAYDN
eukprot:CAMPEP_0117648040 /NCGR_PEP_ID=MMETSP0804-20121206/173_1 /TAXON_ID=1074897 /ORGANISM="Tetraselmis astigmatica, Strain CCMP880" /LENGTH=303 /DNA_ID=CAMNT_0005453577 /DNA_START=132 /DNA_END=1044 /DNA_ORIENTATION=-